MLEIAATFMVIAVLLAYLNQRFVGLPIGVGMMAASLLLSLALLGLWRRRPRLRGLRQREESLLRSIDFSTVLMQGMPLPCCSSPWRCADLDRLRAYRWQIGALAIGSTWLSTVVVDMATWLAFPCLGFELPLIPSASSSAP
jgi:CPA1 family monovalent cation:H+ antiporter